ncbi:hypothetical protein PAAL109150_24685 [Paenibacillus alkaliterrae]
MKGKSKFLKIVDYVWSIKPYAVDLTGQMHISQVEKLFKFDSMQPIIPKIINIQNNDLPKSFFLLSTI